MSLFQTVTPARCAPPCVPECRAPVAVAGPASGPVLPAQVWLSGVSLDVFRGQQTGAGSDGQRRGSGGHRARGGGPKRV